MIQKQLCLFLLLMYSVITYILLYKILHLKECKTNLELITWKRAGLSSPTGNFEKPDFFVTHGYVTSRMKKDFLRADCLYINVSSYWKPRWKLRFQPFHRAKCSGLNDGDPRDPTSESPNL